PAADTLTPACQRKHIVPPEICAAIVARGSGTALAPGRGRGAQESRGRPGAAGPAQPPRQHARRRAATAGGTSGRDRGRVEPARIRGRLPRGSARPGLTPPLTARAVLPGASPRVAGLRLVGFGVKPPRERLPYDEFHADPPQETLAA